MPPLDAIADIVELVEMPADIANRLVDFLVGVRDGVLRRLVGVNNKVAPRPPVDVLAATLKTASPVAIGPWAR